MLEGIDVSNWQGYSFDWEAEHAAGVDYAFIKATEGTSYTDPDFSRNWRVSKERGLARGAYHFMHPEEDIETQAAHFLGVVHDAGLQPGDLLAVDYEITGGLHPSEAAANVGRFLYLIHKDTGASIVVYTTRGLAEAGYCTGMGTNPLWLAAPDQNPETVTPPAPWTLISFIQTGQRHIDTDIGYFDSITQLDRLAVPAPQIPTSAAGVTAAPQPVAPSVPTAPPYTAPATGVAASSAADHVAHAEPLLITASTAADHLARAEQLLITAAATEEPVVIGMLHALVGIGKGLGFL